MAEVTVHGKRRPLDHVATLRPAGHGGKGQAFDVVFNGETIVEGSVDAEFDACRVLKARGVSGRIGFKHEGRETIGLVTPIERGAELTVQDDGRGRPQLRKWKPFGFAVRRPPAATDEP